MPHPFSASPRVHVLVYHRIDRSGTDPWGIRVSPERFDEQISYFTGKYRLLPLQEAMRQVNTGNIEKDAICVTFDDGYSDNYRHALPVLKKYACPATFFIATAFVGQDAYWWDQLEKIFLQCRALPASLTMTVNGQDDHYMLSDRLLTTDQYNAHIHWRWYEEQPTERCVLFLQIWKMLRGLPYPEIQKQIQFLEHWCGMSANEEDRKPMTAAQLEELSSDQLFTLGLHTHTHIDMASADVSAQQMEIQDCRSWLEKHLGQSPDILAYPYGSIGPDTASVAHSMHLQACFTTEGAAIQPLSNRYTLGRLQVCDWSARQLREYLHL